MIGEPALDAASPTVRSAGGIEADGQIYDLTGRGAIPKLMNQHFVAAGHPQNAQQLFDLLEQQQAGVRTRSVAHQRIKDIPA